MTIERRVAALSAAAAVAALGMVHGAAASELEPFYGAWVELDAWPHASYDDGEASPVSAHHGYDAGFGDNGGSGGVSIWGEATASPAGAGAYARLSSIGTDPAFDYGFAMVEAATSTDRYYRVTSPTLEAGASFAAVVTLAYEGVMTLRDASEGDSAPSIYTGVDVFFSGGQRPTPDDYFDAPTLFDDSAVLDTADGFLPYIEYEEGELVVTDDGNGLQTATLNVRREIPLELVVGQELLLMLSFNAYVMSESAIGVDATSDFLNTTTFSITPVDPALGTITEIVVPEPAAAVTLAIGSLALLRRPRWAA